jgi:hypothetical protein
MMLRNWQKLITRAELETNKKIYNVQSRLYGLDREKIGGATLKKAQHLLNEARRNYSFVLLGKAAHNIEYALKLLNVSSGKAEEAMAMISRDHVPEVYDLQLSCTVLCHVEMDKAAVPFGRVTFPHDKHVVEQEMDCGACHSSRESHGKTYLRDCSDCHHGASLGQVTCEDCHVTTADLFYGRNGAGVEGTPGMKSDVIECADCHSATVEGKRSRIENFRASCIGCHEPDYGKKLDSWITAGKELVAHTGSKVEKVRRVMESKKRKGKKIYVSYKNIFDEAERNFELVRKGKAVHNMEYSEALIAMADKKLDDVMKLLEEER